MEVYLYTKCMINYFISCRATEGDADDVAPAKIHVKSSGSVLPYVGVACLGAILFGYHLGYAFFFFFCLFLFANVMFRST